MKVNWHVHTRLVKYEYGSGQRIHRNEKNDWQQDTVANDRKKKKLQRCYSVMT